MAFPQDVEKKLTGDFGIRINEWPIFILGVALLAGREEPSGSRAESHHVEEISRDQFAPRAFRAAVIAHRECPTSNPDHVDQLQPIAQIRKIDKRCRQGFAGGIAASGDVFDRHNLTGIGNAREWIE